MSARYRVALTGDVLLNSRVSVCRDPDVLAAVDLLRGADVTHAHLEVPLHDFADHDTFGAAEGALSWMRGPTWVADELRWLGVDLVSTASNHALDWSYGGMRSTLRALDAAGLTHAGTGEHLAAARAPGVVDTAVARVGLVSATSAFPAFARAGAARTDMRGRPGVNPLAPVDVVDGATADHVARIASQLGRWVMRQDNELLVHPPGLHNSTWRLKIAEENSTCCDETDLQGNLASVRLGAATCDFVIAHLHVQAWDCADGRMSSSPAFVREFARAAVEAGASVVLVQGSHAPVRGLELIDGVPVLHDPGPLFRLGMREVQPHDFYTRWGNAPEVRSFDAGLLQAFAARDSTLSGDRQVLSPREGICHEPGFFLPVCEVDAATHRVLQVRLHPMQWSTARRATTGFPVVARGAQAHAVLTHVAELSAPYGTTIAIDGDTGVVDL